jgi:hypothetical protein
VTVGTLGRRLGSSPGIVVAIVRDMASGSRIPTACASRHYRASISPLTAA